MVTGYSTVCKSHDYIDIITFLYDYINSYIISGGDVGNAAMRFFYTEPFLTYCVLGKDYFYLALYHYYKQASDGKFIELFSIVLL